MKPDQNPETLVSQAFELIEAGDPKTALKIGMRLEKMRYSGAFEIQAIACARLDKKNKAVKILEKGVKLAPEAWLLWQLLGNYESDLGHYDKAVNAFENGLKTKNSDMVSLYYNYANALTRYGKVDAAMNKLQLAFADQHFGQSSKELIQLGFSLLMNLNNQQKNYDATKYAFEVFFRDYHLHHVYSNGLSEIYSELSTAFWKTKKKEEAIGAALRAIHFDRQNQDAQFLLREIRKTNYQNAKYMRIMLHGKWHEPFEGEKEIPKFFTTYDVVADGEEEALNFIKEFEPEAVADSLQIEEVKLIESEKQPKGVYKVSSYYFY
ncbi:tetratricopeptide repeat protein [Rhodoligotrophos ferricapiens]|uniref:tetratricopeptide repeat protein n=1 Tax=Rhodoligotrophos ferricapiens TaxID=3069264 RepID=UPI00315DB769